ncbi:hypothetical protein JCM11491_003298 [Sporobolomyces phaffii]
MPFLNGYTAPGTLAELEYHATTPLEDYDLNWVYGSVPASLETPGGVRLVPLIPSIHGRRLYRLLSAHPDSYAYLPYGPFATYSAFLTKLERVRADPNALSFAVYDLALDVTGVPGDDEEDFDLEGGRGLREERLAGIVGVKESRSENRMTEIGNVHIPPPFQRTHVSTHSISLLLHWLLDPPSSEEATNLGLRRVQWFANPLNEASVHAAERLGFELEARAIRWERTLPFGTGKIALDVPAFLLEDEDRLEVEQARGGGRHSTLLSIDWERWHGGVRDFVDSTVDARPVTTRRIRDVHGLAL